MAYEEAKDVIVQDYGFIIEDDVSVQIRSYDGGEAKVVLMRHFVKKNGEKGSRQVARLDEDVADAFTRFWSSRVK